MFMLVKKAGMDTCFRCRTRIELESELSIEHEEGWQTSPDPVAAFFDLEKISFSHLACNLRAMVPSNKIYPNKKARRDAEGKRYRKTEAYRNFIDRRREKRRDERPVS